VVNDSPAYLLGRLSFDLDRAADHLLQTQLGVSYKRVLFLTVLQRCGTVTQHELAVALGYTDPAVSTMLVGLAKDSYVLTAPSATHGRKRLVSITPKGNEVVTKGRRLLDAHFDQLLVIADIDPQHLRELTERLRQALIVKLQQEKENA
jgi:DNA-binding MarR family transcriptional regulator